MLAQVKGAAYLALGVRHTSAVGPWWTFSAAGHKVLSEQERDSAFRDLECQALAQVDALRVCEVVPDALVERGPAVESQG